jgi:hypothetical protein
VYSLSDTLGIGLAFYTVEGKGVRRMRVPKMLQIAAILGLSLSLIACGTKAKYQKSVYSASATAGVYTKPKIDIVLFQDTSGSMIVPLASLQSQLNDFVSSLDSRWDFHFVVLPLQATKSFASKWLLSSDCSTITGSGTCLRPDQRSYFVNDTTYGWEAINSSSNGTDLAFSNMQANLSQATATSTNFIRSDAALAMIVVSNGEDTTGISYPADYYDRGDGLMVPNYSSSGATTSFNNFKNFIQGIKPAGMRSFYAVVADNNYTNCNGGASWQGKRYMDMAQQVSGSSYNICNSGLSSALSGIKSQLESMIQAYIFAYTVLNAEPVESSIKVFKNGVEVPKSSINGWSYVGYQVNQPIAISPALSNYRSGYMIKMNGTAQYSGTDLISIDYQKK